MKVRELMHTGVQWRSPDTSLAEIARIMRDDDVGAVPLGENDRLVGMITDRDIACRAVAEARDPEKTTARDVMTKGIVYCTEDDEVEDAVHIMEDRGIRRLPVINAKKRMTGMLSVGDLSHRVSRELSGELIGAVSAHHDSAAKADRPSA